LSANTEVTFLKHIAVGKAMTVWGFGAYGNGADNTGNCDYAVFFFPKHNM
jgi:hypothetical protein